MTVHPGLLAASAAVAAEHSQAVLTAHNSTARSLDTALWGWVGSSRSALETATERWAETSTALSLRIHRASESLRISALTFAEMDAGHALRLSAISPPERE